MSVPTENSALHDLLRADIDGFDALAELALDLRWSWNHAADLVWLHLNPALWKLTYNPWAVLQTAARDRIEQVMSDPAFRGTVNELVQARRRDRETPAWFQQTYPHSSLTCVAYFSMEFMLSEALPIYSGGLGNVAGDQLKAASDLGVPVIGVGLLYQQGYFRQEIDRDGNQQALFPYNDPGQLPIRPLRRASGEWLRLEIVTPGYSIWLRTWQVHVGRCRLYLLDTNDPANPAAYRGITSELYGGGTELRLRQELVLGIGGWRLLRELGIEPEVCHLNEGHAAFAVLERARSFMERTGQRFSTALAATRAGNIFTTHTAVPAGFDRFEPALMAQYLGRYARTRLGIELDDLLALGREHPDDPAEPFNMAYLALRGCGAANGVSRLHGAVSRQLFSSLFPHWPTEEVPIGHITNGVHMPSWDSPEADDLWTEASGKERWLGRTEGLEQDIRKVSDTRLWSMRNAGRHALVEFTRESLARQTARYGGSAEEIEAAQHVLDPEALTLGFARRFATYKRPNLLLRDPQRLLALVSDPLRPVQIIIAGKAHPADQAGCDMIRQWTRFIRENGARQHLVFLSDYDVRTAERLVQGVDVWINTPRRPWEACGTSGMKTLVNGGLNLSELDGWWAEAYAPEVGWALGDGQEHGDDPTGDAAEAEDLYHQLESEVVPAFFARDGEGIPTAWVTRIRESMARLTPVFSANRAVREYTEQRYLPAAARFITRSTDQGKKLAQWQTAIARHWTDLHFGATQSESRNGVLRFETELHLGRLGPDAVQVELYADGSVPFYHEMQPMEAATNPSDFRRFVAEVHSGRPATDFTVRVIPRQPGISIPLEDAHILWQR